MKCEKCYCELPQVRQLNSKEILAKGSLFFDISVNDLTSSSRLREIKDARQMLMHVIRELTNLSLKSIGKLFGNRDHTTVIHATKIVRGLCYTEPDYQKRYDSLKSYVLPINNRYAEVVEVVQVVVPIEPKLPPCANRSKNIFSGV